MDLIFHVDVWVVHRLWIYEQNSTCCVGEQDEGGVGHVAQSIANRHAMSKLHDV